MSGGPGRLIAVDGVNGRAVRDAARELARDHHRRRGAVSSWDASGIFDEVTLADDAGTPPSVRTLLLLYAADLAFRLRWEIRPALAEGRIVIAAHYVETAIAFGQAAGLEAEWLADILSFAPRPHATHYVVKRPAKRPHERRGFVEFGCERVAPPPSGFERRALMERARKQLASAARRHRPAKASAGA